MPGEDDLRDMFDSLHASGGPEPRLSAADVVRVGERVRRRRRAAAVTGSGLATVAAIVVAVVLLPGEHGNVPAPVTPAGQNTRPTATSTNPETPATSPGLVVQTTPTR